MLFGWFSSASLKHFLFSIFPHCAVVLSVPEIPAFIITKMATAFHVITTVLAPFSSTNTAASVDISTAAPVPRHTPLISSVPPFLTVASTSELATFIL